MSEIDPSRFFTEIHPIHITAFANTTQDECYDAMIFCIETLMNRGTETPALRNPSNPMDPNSLVVQLDGIDRFVRYVNTSEKKEQRGNTSGAAEQGQGNQGQGNQGQEQTHDTVLHIRSKLADAMARVQNKAMYASQQDQTTALVGIQREMSQAMRELASHDKPTTSALKGIQELLARADSRISVMTSSYNPASTTPSTSTSANELLLIAKNELSEFHNMLTSLYAGRGVADTLSGDVDICMRTMGNVLQGHWQHMHDDYADRLIEELDKLQRNHNNGDVVPWDELNLHAAFPPRNKNSTWGDLYDVYKNDRQYEYNRLRDSLYTTGERMSITRDAVQAIATKLKDMFIVSFLIPIANRLSSQQLPETPLSSLSETVRKLVGTFDSVGERIISSFANSQTTISQMREAFITYAMSEKGSALNMVSSSHTAFQDTLHQIFAQLNAKEKH